MASVFPYRPPVEHTPRERSDVVIGTDDSTDVLQAISSDTAQQVLRTLHDEPTTAKKIADDAGTTLQNIQYHLDRLREVDLVETIGTWYSEKGQEMTVYALTTEELVVRVGSEESPPAGADGRSHRRGDPP